MRKHEAPLSNAAAISRYPKRRSDGAGLGVKLLLFLLRQPLADGGANQAAPRRAPVDDDGVKPLLERNGDVHRDRGRRIVLMTPTAIGTRLHGRRCWSGCIHPFPLLPSTGRSQVRTKDPWVRSAVVSLPERNSLSLTNIQILTIRYRKSKRIWPESAKLVSQRGQCEGYWTPQRRFRRYAMLVAMAASGSFPPPNSKI